MGLPGRDHVTHRGAGVPRQAGDHPQPLRRFEADRDIDRRLPQIPLRQLFGLVVLLAITETPQTRSLKFPTLQTQKGPGGDP